jgi:hypothetical protein
LAERAARQNAPAGAMKARLADTPRQNIKRVPWPLLSHDRQRISQVEWLYDIATHQHGFGRCNL